MKLLIFVLIIWNGYLSYKVFEIDRYCAEMSDTIMSNRKWIKATMDALNELIHRLLVNKQKGGIDETTTEGESN